MEPEEVKKLNKADELAQSVLKLSRNTLLVNLRFLDMALSQFEYIGDHTATLAVDGEHIFYNPRHVLRVYKTDKEQSVGYWGQTRLLYKCDFGSLCNITIITKNSNPLRRNGFENNIITEN